MTTPRQLSRRADLYHQLASLIAAGVPLLSALEMLRNAPPQRALAKVLERILVPLQQGATFAEALQSVGGWMPEFDLALIRAGEESGRLDACFRYLAEYYRERAALARQILSDLAYPGFVLHFAVLIFPTQMLTRLVLQGDVVGFLLSKAAMLLPLYGVIFVLLRAGQPGRSEAWRRGVEQVLKLVPVLGSARTSLSLARLSLGLESLLNAGVSIVQAWELAAAGSGSPRLRRVVINWRADLEAGVTPGEALRESGAFPELFANLYSTGEMSGQLDQTLHRLYQHYQEEASRQLRLVAQWMPRLVYFAVLLLIAYQVVSFWAQYFARISEIAF